MLKIKKVGLMGRVSECAKGRERVGERRRESVKESER
jgi:hypothetical protein